MVKYLGGLLTKQQQIKLVRLINANRRPLPIDLIFNPIKNIIYTPMSYKILDKK